MKTTGSAVNLLCFEEAYCCRQIHKGFLLTSLGPNPTTRCAKESHRANKVNRLCNALQYFLLSDQGIAVYKFTEAGKQF